MSLLMIRTMWAALCGWPWCRRLFLSLHKLYIVVWKASFRRQVSISLRREERRDAMVIDQSGFTWDPYLLIFFWSNCLPLKSFQISKKLYKTCALRKLNLFLYIIDNFFIYLIILFIQYNVFCCYYIFLMDRINFS